MIRINMWNINAAEIIDKSVAIFMVRIYGIKCYLFNVNSCKRLHKDVTKMYGGPIA